MIILRQNNYAESSGLKNLIPQASTPKTKADILGYKEKSRLEKDLAAYKTKKAAENTNNNNNLLKYKRPTQPQVTINHEIGIKSAKTIR